MHDTVTHAPVLLAADSPQALNAKKSVLTPVRLSERRVQVSRMVRRGCFVRLPGLHAVFSIRPEEDTGAEWAGSLFLETEGGLIEMADGAQLIQGLSGIDPRPLQSLSAERRQWFAAALAGRLAETPLAGVRIAASAARVSKEDRCCLQLTLRSRNHMLSTLARAPASAWLDFLSRSDWSFERSPASDLLTAESQQTVQVAQHTLPVGVLRTLAIGDVIVPDSTLFQPDGEGRMRLWNRDVHVRYVAPNSLEILEVKRKTTPEE